MQNRHQLLQSCAWGGFAGFRRGMSVLLCALVLLTAAGFKSSNKYSSPRNTERAVRKQTSLIILHTTEAPAKSSLQKLQANGEAHYCIDTDGMVYRLVDRRKVAFHSGRSMWNKSTNIDEISIGIEMVGYHDKPLTDAQYTALAELLVDLKAIYKVSDQNIMPHSQVAYGTPNRWHKKRHRGRKRCGMAFGVAAVRARIGLKTRWLSDPDVKAKRLVVADPELAKILYAPKGVYPLPYKLPASGTKTPPASGTKKTKDALPASPGAVKPIPTSSGETQTIGKGRSAWDIARGAYNAASTIYIFPDGSRKRGNEIREWKLIPAGTKVLVTNADDTGSEVQNVSAATGAAELAGEETLLPTTFYILPSGAYHRGSEMTEETLKTLPVGTRVLVGYRVGGPVTPKYLPSAICPTRWNAPDTFYLIRNVLHTRDKVNMQHVPEGTMIFYKD